jgi:hypothetical protein
MFSATELCTSHVASKLSSRVIGWRTLISIPRKRPFAAFVGTVSARYGISELGSAVSSDWQAAL